MCPQPEADSASLGAPAFLPLGALDSRLVWK